MRIDAACGLIISISILLCAPSAISWPKSPTASVIGMAAALPGGGIVLASLRQNAMQEEDSIRSELEKSRESARDAEKQAREAREQVSLSENARKAEEKAKIAKAGKKWARLLKFAVATAFLAIVAKIWMNSKDEQMGH